MRKIFFILTILLFSVSIVSADWEQQSFGAEVEVWSNDFIDAYSPTSGATDQELNPTLNITISHPRGNTMSISWQTNLSGSWSTFDNNFSCSNGSYTQTNSNMNSYSTTYYWRVLVTDGSHTDNQTYSFTTKDEPISYTYYNSTFGANVTVLETQPLDITNEDPQNYNESESLNPTLSAYFSHEDGTNMNIRIRTNASGSWSTIYSLDAVGNATRSTSTSNMDSYLTTYYWQACSQDVVTGDWYNETYYFTTQSDTNVTHTQVSPANESTGVSLQPTLQVNPTSNNPSRGNVDMYIRSNASGSWTTLCSYENVAEDVLRSCSSTSSMNSYNTTYYWSANSSLVGETEWTNDTYHFTTLLFEDAHNITYHSSSFGASVHVYEPGVSYVSRSFGAEVEVYAYEWSNWSNWWVITRESSTLELSNFQISHNQRHCVDWINFTVDGANVSYVFLNITTADSTELSINITQNNSGSTYWSNRTFDNGAVSGGLPYGWPEYGNGTYTVNVYAYNDVNSTESSPLTFIIYPTADVTMNNMTWTEDVSAIFGDNWTGSGDDRFCIHDVNGNGQVWTDDISYIFADANWQWFR